jgi:glutamate-1-semialdehyde 2,1-aminomutase
MVKREGNSIAAVISEPIMMNIGTVLPEGNFLHELQDLCRSNGILFILDEVISGFRLAPGGAQEYFHLDPDLATYAKALGAGFPIAAVTGKREFMQDVVPGKITHSGTYYANPLCVSAAYASLSYLSKDNGAIYKHLNEVGTSLKKALEDAVAATNTEAIVQGEGAMGTQLYFTKRKKISNYRDFFSCDTQKYLRFHKELLKRGIYFHAQQYEHLFVCTEHSKSDTDKLKEAATQALKSI